MLCGPCETRLAKALWLRAASSPARVWGPHRLGDLLCAACGSILPGEDIADRLLHKQSQLAQFGLAGAAGPLLEATRRKVG